MATEGSSGGIKDRMAFLELAKVDQHFSNITGSVHPANSIASMAFPAF